jgi:hypothetical protein
MTVTPRLLVASVLASATLGGAVGALATAATTSQASPQAIAAAVQKVSDQTAEHYLRFAGVELQAINAGTEVIEVNQKALQASTEKIQKYTFDTCFYTAHNASQQTDCGPRARCQPGDRWEPVPMFEGA